MRINGFQTFLTETSAVTAFTFTPFCIGWGERREISGRVGIFDIVILGLGLSFEWEKGDSKNDRGHTRTTRPDSTGETRESAAAAASVN